MEHELYNWKKKTLMMCAFLLIAGISGLFAQVNLKEGLVAYYPFDGGLKDVSGNENHADNHRANRAIDLEGSKKGSYRFYQKKDYLKIPVNINPGAMPQMAMCAWVYPFSSYKSMTIISNDDRGGDRKIYTEKRDGKQTWVISDGAGKSIGSVPVVKKKWVFLVANYDDESGYASIYVDGKKTLGKTQMDMGMNYTVIGSNPKKHNKYEVLIDEVRIYDRLLKPDEIDSLMKLKNPVPIHTRKMAKETYYVPKQDNLIIRSQPFVSSAKMGMINKTDTLRIFEIASDKANKYLKWLAFDFNGKTGYANTNYLDERTVEDDERSEIEAYLDDKMKWSNWEYWAIMGGMLLIAILGIVFFPSIDEKLSAKTGSNYNGVAYFPIVSAVVAGLFAMVLVFWQTPVEYYLIESFTLWPYGYGFGTWLAWGLMAILAITFVAMFIESITSTNPIHALLRIVIQTLLAALIIVPVMIITIALFMVFVVILFLGAILGSIGGYRYVVVRY